MKRFEAPVMDVQRLDPDEAITTSCGVCNSVGCIRCYCGTVSCSPVYTCTSLECPTLDTGSDW